MRGSAEKTPGDVGVDFAHVGAQRGREGHGAGVRPAASERGDVAGVGRHPLEAGHEHDVVLFQRRLDAVGADVEDHRLGVGLVGDDPGLGAGQRDRQVPEVVDRHRAQGAGDALARGQQHVHLAGVGRRGDLLGHRDQLVGGLAAGGEDRDDRVAAFARGHDPAGGALDPLGVRHRGAAELHHHQRLAHSSLLPANALPSVTSSAYSRSEPTGRPLASRVTLTWGARERSSSAM